jgi:putative transposase
MGVQALADMSDVERKLALERYKLLEPHLQNGRELRSVSKGSDVSFRTLQRWVAGYKREGLAGLVRKGRMDSGERRTVTPRLCEAIEGLALEKPPLPLTSVHRQAKQFAHLVGEPAPSYWVVRDIVLSLPNDLRTLAQRGTRRFGELYELVHRREASRPNAVESFSGF